MPHLAVIRIPKHTHHFRIAYHLPLGIPDAWGWVATVLVRECRTCAVSEVLHATRRLDDPSNTLLSWESWAPWGMEDEGSSCVFEPIPGKDTRQSSHGH